MLDTKVAKMADDPNGVKVNFEHGDGTTSEKVYEKVLVSIGRRPNGQIPGIDKTKVQVDAKGFIGVDAQRRTAEPTLYAIGDVAGEPMLAHKATYEAKIAVEAIAGHKVAYEPRAIPAVVFTDPELAWCGLTEQEAKRDNIPHEVAKFPWGASGRATSIGRTDGLTKIIFDPKTERVLGVGIVGVGAGEMIAEGTLAVEMAAVATDLAMTIHAHPDARRDGDGIGRRLLRPRHARLPAQEEVSCWSGGRAVVVYWQGCAIAAFCRSPRSRPFSPVRSAARPPSRPRRRPASARLAGPRRGRRRASSSWCSPTSRARPAPASSRR